MLISIWGRDGIGKSTLADVLGCLYSRKNVTVVVDTDLMQPTLPSRISGGNVHPDNSLGKAISGIGTENAARFLYQHPKKKNLFYAGLTDGDEYLSYEIGLEADDNAQNFIEGCRDAADTVILDLSGQRTDPFVPGALINSDKIIVLMTPDVQGVCWYIAVEPLLKMMNTKGRILPVAAMTDRHHDLSAVEKAAGVRFSAALPFARELRRDSTVSPLDGTSHAALRYAKQAEQLYALLKGGGEV